MRLIKQIYCAEAVYEALRTPVHGLITDSISLAMSIVEQLPTVDAEPVRHGKWVNNRCSICNAKRPIHYVELRGVEVWRYEASVNYCTHCGAKMDEVEE